MKTVAIDLDGTLAEYDKWRGWSHIGGPIHGAKDALTKFKSAGWRVIVYTCRLDVGVVREWCDEHLHDLVDAINCNPEFVAEHGVPQLKPVADIYIDDRAYPFCGTIPLHWGQIMSDLTRRQLL